MTPIQQQASAVLSALEEGKVIGLIMAYEKISPNCTKYNIVQFLKQFNIEDLDYWIEWFGLNK